NRVDEGLRGPDEEVVERLSRSRLERRVGAGIVVEEGAGLDQQCLVLGNGAAALALELRSTGDHRCQEPHRALLIDAAAGAGLIEQGIAAGALTVDPLPGELTPPFHGSAVGAGVRIEENGAL